jgi:hypothetical protein
MKLEMHPAVQKVAEFMQRELKCDELHAVADALPAVAAVIWAQHSGPRIRPMELKASLASVGADHQLPENRLA